MEKADWRLETGQGRLKVALSAWRLGPSYLVCLYNNNAHLGAVAVAEYDPDEARASSSVITRRGHRDDEIAKKEAHYLARCTRKAVCVVAGIHLDNITTGEITGLLANTHQLIEELARQPDFS